MELSGKLKFHLTKSFFVISKEELEQYLYATRKNVLTLVHYGFTREELYYMPLTEYMDYIKILNDETPEEEQTESAVSKEIDKYNDIKMAGNTVF